MKIVTPAREYKLSNKTHTEGYILEEPDKKTWLPEEFVTFLISSECIETHKEGDEIVHTLERDVSFQQERLIYESISNKDCQELRDYLADTEGAETI